MEKKIRGRKGWLRKVELKGRGPMIARDMNEKIVVKLQHRKIYMQYLQTTSGMKHVNGKLKHTVDGGQKV